MPSIFLCQHLQALRLKKTNGLPGECLREAADIYTKLAWRKVMKLKKKRKGMNKKKTKKTMWLCLA